MLLAFLLSWAGALAQDGAAPSRDTSPGPVALEPAAEEGEALRLGDHGVRGEVRLGWRFRDVSGNRAQFDESLRLDEGPVLMDLLLEGERIEGSGPLESFLIRMEGIGDPDSHYRAEAGLAGLRVTGRFDRSRYSGAAAGDVHAFDLTRDRGSLVLEGTGDVRAGLRFDYGRRDGFTLGTRSVDFGFVSGVAVRRKETRLGTGGELGLEVGGFRVDLHAGIEDLETRDRRAFEAPSPSDPGSIQTEEFAADVDGLAGHGELRITRTFADGRWKADLGLGFHSLSSDGDLSIFESGILMDPSLPFERSTAGSSAQTGRELEAHFGLTFRPTDGTSLEVRYSHVEETERGDLLREIVLDEFMGPPSELTILDRVRDESRLDVLEGGVTTSLTAWAELDLRVEAGTEDLEVLETFEGSVLRTFDDTVDEYGANASLALDAGRRWFAKLSGGYRVRPTETALTGVFFDFEDERGRFASLSTRWRPRPGISFNAKVRRTDRTSQAFDAEATTDSFSLGATFASDERWSADASFAYRDFGLESETTILILDPFPVQVPALATFDEIERIFHGSLTFAIAPELRPRLGFGLSLVSGDSELSYGSAFLDIPWAISPEWGIGAELSYHRFDADRLLDASDFDAAIALLYIRRSF